MKYFKLTGHKSFVTSINFYEEPESSLLRIVTSSLDSTLSFTDIITKDLKIDEAHALEEFNNYKNNSLSLPITCTFSKNECLFIDKVD